VTDSLNPVGLAAALADLHRRSQPNDVVGVALTVDPAIELDQIHDLAIGAGFSFVGGDPGAPVSAGQMEIRLRREWSLADSVSNEMRVLVCGLNPSPASADAGVSFARPGNRFWPAALDAGLVTSDREPVRALAEDGVGFTDLVKRTTRTAAELTSDEYRSGTERVRRLVTWLQPDAVCFVGLSGWRAAVDPSATAGWQSPDFGDRPTYLMPSTSGLNAHETRESLAVHFRTLLSEQSH